MKKLKRQIIISVCAGFAVLYLISLWRLTVWKTEDLSKSMYSEFMAAYEMLFQQSGDDDFTENSEEYLTEFSVNLAKHSIYGAAVILDAQGDIAAWSDVRDIPFGERGLDASALDLNRLADCNRDAQESSNIERLLGQPGSSVGSSGSFGYTEGWTLGNDKENLQYVLLNAKFFEDELAVKSMILRYVYMFIAMAAVCALLCFVVSRLFLLKDIRDYNLPVDAE